MPAWTRHRRLLVLIAALSCALSLPVLAQMRQRFWARYEREMQDPIDDPPDALTPAEFAFGRLRYRSPRDGFRRARWGTDANKGERLFIIAIRRLSRINAQSIEEIVDVGSDDLYNWPFMYAVAAAFRTVCSLCRNVSRDCRTVASAWRTPFSARLPL